MGRRAAQLLLDVLKHGRGKLRTVRMLPQFIPGETLGPAGADEQNAESSDTGMLATVD
jgi:hypothetical protein